MIELKKPREAMFMGLNQGAGAPVYPRWLHREDTESILVNNTDEEKKARADGYDSITATALSNTQLINWFWDFEDMSPKQLRVYASEEYGVDLPAEASQETLFKAVLELTRYAPQNRNRLVLMAHTIKLEYEVTLEEIRRLSSGNGQGIEIETETFEIYA